MAELTILGGGPAGLGVAYYAHRAGHRFTLYEKSDELGGMCRTFQCDRHRYDAGAHRFHDRDAEITSDLQDLMNGELRRVRAPSKLWNRGKLIDFPPTPLNAAFSFGILGAGRIGFEVLSARLRARTCSTFRDFAEAQFGRTLAQRLLIDYSEKLWGLPADQLSPDIATRRLSGMTIYSLLLELLFPARKTAHIDGEFFYPRRGYGEIAKRLSAALPRESLVMQHEITALESHNGAVTHVHFGNARTIPVGDRLVSTLPLTLLVRLLGKDIATVASEAAARLRFRQLRLIFLRLDRPQVSDNASIYIPSPDFKVSRVYEPKVRSAQMAPEAETSLVAEIACFPGDAVSVMPADALAAQVIDELHSIRLIDRRQVLEWRHHVLPFAYPVYSLNYPHEVATITDALASFTNVDTVGRAANFFYSHLHDHLRASKNYVRALTGSGESITASDSGSEEINAANLKFALR